MFATKTLADKQKADVLSDPVGQRNKGKIVRENGLSSSFTDHLIQVQQTVGNRRAQLLVQAKLKLGAPDGKFEREADRVAQQVTQNISLANGTPAALVQRTVLPTISTAPPQSGLPLSPILEAGIRTAKGQGQSLSSSIRHTMEQSFGAPLGNVQIHTNQQANQLSQSLQARAFTVGNHIFFRQGEYQPQQKWGQQLLAHEITHVLHQNSDHVQLKIGFEFETHQNARFEDQYQAETKVFDHIKIGSTPFFDLEGDGSKVEIITKPVNEDKEGFSHLIEIMRNISNFATPIHKNRISISELDKADQFRLNLMELENVPEDIEMPRLIYNERDKKHYKAEDFYINGAWGKGMVFNPHITVGVKLTTLDKLLLALTNMPRRGEDAARYSVARDAPAQIQKSANQLGWQQSETGAGYQQALQLGHQALQSLDKLEPPQELRGFLHLLGTFVGGHHMAEIDASLSREWEKYKLPIMSRSHLGEVFSKLEPNSQEWFKNHRQKIVKGLTAIQYGKFQKKTDRPLFHTAKFKEHNRTELTVELIVKELMGGIDPLGSRFEARSVGEIQGPNKKYGVEHAADIGNGRKGMILELRRMGRDLEIKELMPYALAAHKLIVEINQLKGVK